jgi:hypothetical protein
MTGTRKRYSAEFKARVATNRLPRRQTCRRYVLSAACQQRRAPDNPSPFSGIGRRRKAPPSRACPGERSAWAGRDVRGFSALRRAAG